MASKLAPKVYIQQPKLKMQPPHETVVPKAGKQIAAGSTAPDVLDIYNKKRSTIEASHVDHPQRLFIVEGFIHKTPSGVSALFTCIGILKS